MTIDEIAERLALPRTTIYHWVKDLPIEPTNRQSEAQRRATEGMRTQAAARRAEAYRRGVAEFESLRLEPTFEHFVCLYLAEGSKRSRNRVAICNSDPAVIVLSNRWILHFAGRPVSYSVQYHADQDIDEIRSFWGDLVGVDPARVSVQRKSNSNQLAGRSWRSEHGVLTVRIGDTPLRARLQAWMDLLRAEWV